MLRLQLMADIIIFEKHHRQVLQALRLLDGHQLALVVGETGDGALLVFKAGQLQPLLSCFHLI